MTGLLERPADRPVGAGPAAGERARTGPAAAEATPGGCPGRATTAIQGGRPDPATAAIPGVCLRPATAADSAAVRAFLRGLSLDTAYRRFFTGLGSVPDSLVRRLLATGGTRTVVLATVGAEVVGLADTTVVDGGAAVELGVVLADRWQCRGLGRPLAEAALAPAVAGDIGTLRAHTLPDNARVARLLRRRWPAARSRFEDGTLVWDIDLSGPVGRER